MIGFLSFHWLPLLFLALPVAIHLWNRQKARRVYVGGLRQLPSYNARKWKRVRLESLVLLLFRCFAVLLAAGLLMGPVWLKNTKLARRSPQVTVFVSPDLLPISECKPILECLDSLGENGSLRLLGNHAGEMPNHEGDGGMSPGLEPILPDGGNDNWSLLRAIGHDFGPNEPRIVFLDNRQNNYKGTKPYLSDRTQIHILPIRKKTNWIQGIAKLPDGKCRILVGQSDEQGVRFAGKDVAIGPEDGSLHLPGVGKLDYQTLPNGTTRFSSPDSSIVCEFGLDTLALQVDSVALIVCDKGNNEDALYVDAALNALADVFGLALKTQQAVVGEKLDTSATHFFWLSAVQVPDALVRRLDAGATLFCYQPGGGLSEAEVLITQLWDGEGRAARLGRFGVLPNCGTAVWETQSGQPVLCRRKVGSGLRYDFAGRFQPAHTNLVEGAELARWLLPVVLPGGGQVPVAEDMRTVSPELLMPVKVGQPESLDVLEREVRGRVVERSLHFPMWLLLCCLLAVEWLASCRRLKKGRGGPQAKTAT